MGPAPYIHLCPEGRVGLVRGDEHSSHCLAVFLLDLFLYGLDSCFKRREGGEAGRGTVGLAISAKVSMAQMDSDELGHVSGLIAKMTIGTYRRYVFLFHVEGFGKVSLCQCHDLVRKPDVSTNKSPHRAPGVLPFRKPRTHGGKIEHVETRKLLVRHKFVLERSRSGHEFLRSSTISGCLRPNELSKFVEIDPIVHWRCVKCTLRNLVVGRIKCEVRRDVLTPDGPLSFGASTPTSDLL